MCVAWMSKQDAIIARVVQGVRNCQCSSHQASAKLASGTAHAVLGAHHYFISTTLNATVRQGLPTD